MSESHEWQLWRNQHRLLEDEAILAVNKPAGIAVTGDRHETDMVRMAQLAGEQLYPVHRIDKATSGLVLCAKQLDYHGDLTRQFNKRTVAKSYLAITKTRGMPAHGTIDLPLCTGRKNRVRVAASRKAILADDGTFSVNDGAVFSHTKTYPSVTKFAKVWQNRHYTLLMLRPLTGRRHQIRVHLAWIGHAVHGDPLFETDAQSRMLLHSWQLSFNARWQDDARTQLTAPPPADFWEAVSPIDTDTVLTYANKMAAAD